MNDPTPPETDKLALTDAGRAHIRRMRIILLPVRTALVLGLLALPAGGLGAAWGMEHLRPFLLLMALTIALERSGITADGSAASRDRYSKLALVLAVFGPLAWGMRSAATGFAAGADAWPVEVRLLGSVAWVAGLSVRQWAMQTLGRFFTDRVRIFEDHALVTGGPYRWVRHPSYAGLALVMVGAPFTLGSVSASAAGLVLGGLGLGWRIAVEERALASAFGAQWAQYAANTPRLLPRPFARR